MARRKKTVSHLKTKKADVRLHLRGKSLVLTVIIPREMQQILAQRLAARLLKQKKSFDEQRAVKLYMKGQSVPSIASTMGYPHGRGQNRVRAALVEAGVYKTRTPKKGRG